MKLSKFHKTKKQTKLKNKSQSELIWHEFQTFRTARSSWTRSFPRFWYFGANSDLWPDLFFCTCNMIFYLKDKSQEASVTNCWFCLITIQTFCRCIIHYGCRREAVRNSSQLVIELISGCASLRLFEHGINWSIPLGLQSKSPFSQIGQLLKRQNML